MHAINNVCTVLLLLLVAVVVSSCRCSFFATQRKKQSRLATAVPLAVDVDDRNDEYADITSIASFIVSLTKVDLPSMCLHLQSFLNQK